MHHGNAVSPPFCQSNAHLYRWVSATLFETILQFCLNENVLEVVTPFKYLGINLLKIIICLDHIKSSRNMLHSLYTICLLF